MKKRIIGGAFAIAALVVIYAGTQENIKKSKNNAERCIQLKGDSMLCDDIQKGFLDESTRIKLSEALEQRKARREAREAKRQEEFAKLRARADQAKLKASEEIAKAEAKFKEEGWFQLEPGIYGRWCTETCSNADVIGDATYWLMEVWAKEKAAGDIYAQVNILKDGVVIGWTNDTAFLSEGQKGVLTFSKYLPGGAGQYSAQIVKFNARM